MLVKTSELIGRALNFAVAKAEGREVMKDFYLEGSLMSGWFVHVEGNRWMSLSDYVPSTAWAQGGPIIEREGVDIQQLFGGSHEGSFARHVGWQAKRYIAGGVINPSYFNAQTPLIAAMRCFVASKLGDEVEIPEELL